MDLFVSMCLLPLRFGSGISLISSVWDTVFSRWIDLLVCLLVMFPIAKVMSLKLRFEPLLIFVMLLAWVTSLQSALYL